MPHSTPAWRGRVARATAVTAMATARSVEPHPCDLKWSRGAVPTPHGAISVDRTFNPSPSDLDVDGSTGTTGTVSVPEIADSTVGVDGTTVRAHGHSLGSGAQLSDDYVSVTVGARSHHIVATCK
ncbi:alpha-L-rhamnosidase C-terminal domain-containing protein [Streptomyces sp. NPDC005125]